MSSNDRKVVRQNRYKVAVDAEEGRRRREDTTVQTRKSKREESLLKKRREGHQSQQLPPNYIEILPLLVGRVWSTETALQLEATTQFRELLCIETTIEQVIQTGVVPRLVEFLAREDHPQLQYEAAWALTNIASGTSNNTRVVIDSGAVPMLVKLLAYSRNVDVREQAVWALGNIVGDSPGFRDLVLSSGALLPLLAQLNEHAKLSMLRIVTWTLSNFCMGEPRPQLDQVKPALPALERLLHSDDDQVLRDACLALWYLSDGTNDRIQAVIEVGVCPRLVQLLSHPSPVVTKRALRTVGNIVTGDDVQTQCVIATGALPCLLRLLTRTNISIRREVCWTISNITAGNREQIQSVIKAGLIGPLVNLLRSAEFGIKKEAAWAILNAVSWGTHEQIKVLVTAGCIKPLSDLLVCPDPTIVIHCLKGLEKILKVGEAENSLGNRRGTNLYAQLIDEAGGLEKIEGLQNHDNNDIYEQAVKILETYWLEDEDETLPVGDNNGPQFSTSGFNLG